MWEFPISIVNGLVIRNICPFAPLLDGQKVGKLSKSAFFVKSSCTMLQWRLFFQPSASQLETILEAV
jgi:hypothetical protein